MTPDNLDPPTEVIPTNPPSEPNLQTQNPTGPTNVDEVTAVFQNVVREGNRREQLLREELQRLRTESTRPASPVDTRPAWERFAEDPEALIRKVVAEQTRELNQTAADIQRRTAYESLINSATASNPGFGQLYQVAKIHIDAGMQTLQPTPENLAGVVRNVVGAIALGEIKVNMPANNNPAPNPNPTPTPPTPNNVPTPPNIPPSAPPLPGGGRKTTKHPRELTENERHLMRLRGWNEDRWWQEMGADYTELSSAITVTDKPRV
jgi:hypothetical protein